MSKTIDEETVVHLAELVRITLSEKEKTEFAKQLSNIIGFFSQLSELNTENVNPTYHVLDIKNVFRPDEPGKSISQDEALKNAPDTQDGFFKAPRIVDE